MLHDFLATHKTQKLNGKTKDDKTPENKELNVMINFNEVMGENTQEQNPQCSQILDHPYRILNALLNLINQRT